VETIIGVFAGHDAALGAGERAREVTGPGSSIRVFLPGDKGTVVEADVLRDRGSFLRTLLASFGIGIIGSGVFMALRAGWQYAALWLAWSLFAGVMMAAWLTGQRVKAQRRMRTSCDQAIAAGQALVTAMVDTQGEVEKVERVFEGSGGQVMHA
jgi:hypothetical protein